MSNLLSFLRLRSFQTPQTLTTNVIVYIRPKNTKQKIFDQIPLVKFKYDFCIVYEQNKLYFWLFHLKSFQSLKILYKS